ncbi:MAG: SusD/RagB family nutrient-binding outer membrane lipoprotein [Chitinophagaceae bacterium]|nr:SusD/RagB family nutrient-binding outer membrane lipoprotein [Chitinophagaceae bacterium]
MNCTTFSTKRILHFVCASLLFISVGCTKNYEEINTDPTRITTLSNQDIKGLFTRAEYMAMYSGDGSAEYQYAQGFFADLYAQYSAITATFDPTDRYNISQEWIQEQWIGTFRAMAPLVNIIKQTPNEDQKALNAIARIWKVWTVHRATDYYGPFPYTYIGYDSTVIPYDRQEDIYMDLFKELQEASADLQANLSQSGYGEADVIFGGDNAKWLKFANTLRLRLAMRISYVKPDMAKTEAEAAVAGGVMVDLADDAYLKSDGINYNGYLRQSGWNEFRMSQTMESLLVGYDDPRLSKFWQPSVNTGEYKGVRNGMNVAEIVAAENEPDNTSGPSDYLLPENMSTTPSTVMYTAEAYFLRAEGALNGWEMGADAQELYETGIEMSLRTWGITDAGAINTYINSTNLPMAPGGMFNTPALTDIPVKFETDPERRREQILTQKWIALFPEGHEAWAEIRRSGYPKLYPILHNDNSALSQGEFIRRIPFLNYDRDRNGPAVEAAVDLLGGPDNIGTPLWWDVH